MYRGKNGFILQDATAPGGSWTISSPEDIITALLSYPALQTVAEGILWEKLAEATAARKVYADVRELAQELLTNYI